MKTMTGKGLRLYAASLFLSSMLGASSTGTELVLLLDSSHLEAGDDARLARAFLRDLVDNLPPRVNVRAFQFGGGSGLIPCQPLLSECLRAIPAAGGRWTLQQALTQAESLLCDGGADPESPGRVLLVMGESAGERLSLASRCRIELIALGMGPQEDPDLSELARRVRGAYSLLAKARGYTVASRIRKEVWQPAVQRELERRKEDSEDPPLFWLGSGLAAFLALTGAALLRFALRGNRQVAESRSASSDPTCAADLRIGSGMAFALNGRQPVILGGRRQTALSSAHLLIDDPEVAGEHCRICAEGCTFFVADLGSGKGTFVNGEPVAGRKALTSGDRLRIGGTTFEILYR